MKTLNEIFIETGTDKADQHPYKGHDYARHYDRLFHGLRHDKLKMLEIGVGGGESVVGWLEYFHQGHVYGMDNNQATNPWNTVGSGIHPRYTFVHGDQSDKTMWACFLADHGKDWDIVIDDGGHFSNQVFITLREMWPHVKKGGLYCIEDVEVAYQQNSIFLTPGVPTHREIMHQLIDDLNGYGKYDSIYFARGLVIIKK